MSLFSQNTKNEFPTDYFKTKSGKQLSISFIKHASLAINYDGFYLQVDPVIKQEKLEIDYSVFPKADVILVTHEHYDHLDVDAIKILSKPNTKIIVSDNCKQSLDNCIVLKPKQSYSLNNGILIETVYAYNTTKSHLQFHPKNRGDLGFIITIENIRIYIAGDTEDIPEMEEISNIDIAFLPVNQPYTMTVEQAEKVAKIINPQILYPYHYSETNVKQLVTRLKDTSIEVRIRDMQ